MYIEITHRRGAVETSCDDFTRRKDDDGRGEIALEISPTAVFLRDNRELIQYAFKSHQRTSQSLLAPFPELSNYLPRYDN